MYFVIIIGLVYYSRSKTMEIVEVIKPKENVKELIEEKLKKEIKEVTP